MSLFLLVGIHVENGYRCTNPDNSFVQQADAYKSDTEALAVSWRSLDLFVTPNQFLCTDAENENTMIVLYYCGIPSGNLSLMPVCASNV